MAQTDHAPPVGVSLDASLEVQELRRRLDEAEETLRAIRTGQVDAVVVSGPQGDQVFALKGAEQPYRIFVEAMNEGAATLFSGGVITYCNNRLAEMVHKPLEQVIGTHFEEFVAGDHRQRLRSLLSRAVTRSCREEFPLLSADGNPVWTLLSLNPVVIDTAQGICLVAQDITERKRAQEESRRANAYNRSLIEASLDPLVTIAPDGKITDVNLATEKATGRSRKELIGTDFSIYFTDPERARAIHQKVFRDGQVQNYALEIRDGKITPVVYNASVYRDESGQVAGVFAAARDISERLRAEEEVHRLNRELEERVRLRTLELENANRDLDSFSYSISHDLRAPLRAISGFSTILLDEYAPHLPAEAQRLFGRVRENAGQMEKLIQDLLAFSRLGRQQVSKRTVDPGELVQQALVTLASEREGRHVEITVGDLPMCQGDSTLLEQVFVNLLSNALKYSRKREVARIEVGTAKAADLPKDAAIEGVDPGEIVYFVRDNGVGFDMQYAGKLFGVFQRLHSAGEYEGTGVGLAIVRRIVHRHGGQVWATAAVDQGATFYFTLGVHSESAPALQASGEAHS